MYLLVSCGSNDSDTVVPTYTIGGMVSGLEGSGLVLQNNLGNNLSISTNGSFTFATALADNSIYIITVLTQPNSPNQTCSVTNGSGFIDGANITDVAVDCITDGTTIGPNVGQIAPDFSLFDTLNNLVTMSTELVGSDGLVLYFTMWCPICNSHMSHMRSEIIPKFPNVKFFIIDYVSGTIELSREAQLSNGFTDLTVLVDNIQEVLTLYQATMGTTVVIDNTSIVRMNEYYKDGTQLVDALNTL